MELSCVPQVLVVFAAASKMVKEGLTHCTLVVWRCSNMGGGSRGEKSQGKTV